MSKSRKPAKRLKYKNLFVIVLLLTIVDFIIPDIVPFIDEALLSLLSLILGSIKERIDEPEQISQTRALK